MNVSERPMLSQLKLWWRIIRTIILAIGVLLAFFVFAEILHVYVVLKNTYAPLGYAFLVVVVGICAWISIYSFRMIKKIPKVLTPPDIHDPPSETQARSYCKYLIGYVKRLADNPNLSPDDIVKAKTDVQMLEKRSQSGQQLSDLLSEIEKVGKESIEPLLSKLKQKAEREVRNSVRDIMMGVTLSPYRAVDLLIVVYRNGAMVLRIMRIYNSRPLLKEQILVLRDVLKVVATVNYLNFGEKLMERFLSCVPYVGRALDDFAQGIGAGLLTSATGHGAIYRCEAYRGWNQQFAVDTMSSHITELMRDVKNIFTKDILPRMKSRVYSTTPSEKTDDPGFWDNTISGISRALEATDTLVVIVKKPIGFGSEKTKNGIFWTGDMIAKTGKGINDGVKQTASGTWKGIRRAGSKAWAIFKPGGGRD